MEQEKTDNGVGKKILIIVMYVCAVLMAVFSSFVLSANFWLRLFLMLCGLVIGLAVTALFHEGGHALVAKRNGFEVAGFSFFIFRYDKQAIKKFSVSFKNSYLGATDIVPTRKGDLGKRYAKTVAGGILGGVIAVAILVAGFITFMALSAPLGAIFFCGMPLSVVIFIINAVPNFVPDNDGSVLAAMLSDGDEKKNIEKLLEITEELYEGKSYAEIDGSLFEPEQNASESIKARFALLRLRRAEELFEPKDIVAGLEELQNAEDYLDDEAAIEMLFAYIMLEDDGKIEEYEYLLDKCDTLPGASGMRTLVYYAAYKGDEKYVKATLKSAKKICAKAYLEGDGKFNAEMLSRL